MANVLEISLKLEDGQDFNKVIDEATKSVGKLNTAVSNLSTTLDKLGGGASAGGLSSLKKTAKDLGEIVTLINSQQSLGRGNLENLSRTAGVVSKFVVTLSGLNDSLKSGSFDNIKSFSGIMKTIGDAFAALDKIKRPANLAVIESAVTALLKVLDALEKNIPRTGRFSKFSKFQNVVKSLADALSAFDKIQKPANMSAVLAGVLAIDNALVTMSKLNLGIISRITRGRQLGQLSNIAKSLAKALSQFDQIKRPENLEKITPAINSLNRVINSLSTISTAGQKLARGGLSGLFSQKGTLLEGFETFAKKINKILKVFSKLDKNGVRSVEASATVVHALVSLLRLFETESSVFLRGEDTLAEFSAKDIDLSNFKNIIKEVIDVAQYISRQSFDPDKVLAIGKLFDNFNKLPTNIRTGTGIGGIFGGLITSAKNAIDSVLDTFRAGAKLIGNVFSTLFVSNPFKSMLSYAQQTVSQLSQTFRNLGKELTSTGLQVLTTGGIAGFIQSQNVGMVMDFEAIMKQIEVLGGVVGDELTSAEELILQLGESSVFSASEVAAAFLDLSKAGLSVDQISASMENMLNLAAAGEISVQEASNLVINAVGAMGLTFEDSTRIVDAFVAAANVGVADVGDLAAAFGYVGNTAGAMGQELETVTAALTLMIDKGIDYTRAGTSLDAFMRSLINPSADAMDGIRDISVALREMEESTGVLSNLGISFEGDLAGLITDAEGNYRELNDIIKLITIATEDWTESERVAALTQVAGSANAARAILALTGTYEDGTYVLDQYITKQEGAASASEVGAALMDTTRGSLEELSGAFETLLLKGLQPVIENGIRPLIDGLTFVVRQISQLPTPVLAGTAAFIGIATILTTITGALMVFGGIAMQVIGFALVPLSTALWALVNPIRALISILALQGTFLTFAASLAFVVPVILTLVGAIRAFKDGLEQLKNTPVLNRLANSIAELKTSVSTAFTALQRFLRLLWSLTEPGVSNENKGLVANILLNISRLAEMATAAIKPLGSLFNVLSDFMTIPSSAALFGISLPNVSDLQNSVTGIADSVTSTFSAPITESMVEGLLGGAGLSEKLTKEAFAEAFGAPLEDLVGDFNFDVAKDWLIMNSTDYDSEIAKLREMSDATGGIADSLDLDKYTTVDFGSFNKSTKAIKETTTQLRSLDDVLSMLDEDSEAFKTLASNLEPFTDNPIVEMLFGEDVTGADLARTFAVVLTTLSNLRSVGSQTLRTFAEFFSDLRSGVGIVGSFKNLIKGLAVDAGMLASVLLDVTTSLFGIGGFDDIIADLAAGNLKGAFLGLAGMLVQQLIETVKTVLSTTVDVLVWSWGTLLDFVDDVNWTEVFNTLWNTAKDSWNNVVKPQFSIAWQDILDFTGLGKTVSTGLAEGLSAGGKTLGPAFEGTQDTALVFDWSALFSKAFSGIKSALEFTWSNMAWPTLKWSWDKVLDLTATIVDLDWAGAWDSVVNSIRSFFGLGGGGGGGGDTITTAVEQAAGEAEIGGTGNKPISLNLGSLIEFIGFGSVVDAFTGEWALAEDAIKLIPLALDLVVDIFVSITKILFSLTGGGGGGGGAAPTGGGGGAAPTGGGQTADSIDWGALIGGLITESLRGAGYVVVEIAEIFFDMDRTKWRGNVDAVVDGLNQFFTQDVGNLPIIGPLLTNFVATLERIAKLDSGAIVFVIGSVGGALLWLNRTALASSGETMAIRGLLALDKFSAILTGLTGIQITGVASGLTALGGSIVIVTAGVMVLNGVLKAAPYFMDMITNLLEGDWEGAAQSAGLALQNFAEGIFEIAAGILELAGVDLDKIFSIDGTFVGAAKVAVIYITDQFEHLVSDVGDFFDNMWEGVKRGFVNNVILPLVTGDLAELANKLGADIDIEGWRNIGAELNAENALGQAFSGVGESIGEGTAHDLIAGILAKIPEEAVLLGPDGERLGGLWVDAFEDGVRNKDLRTIGNQLALDMFGGITDLSAEEKLVLTDLISVEGIRDQINEQLRLAFAADDLIGETAAANVLVSLGQVDFAQLDEDGKQYARDEINRLLTELMNDTEITPEASAALDTFVSTFFSNFSYDELFSETELEGITNALTTFLSTATLTPLTPEEATQVVTGSTPEQITTAVNTGLDTAASGITPIAGDSLLNTSDLSTSIDDVNTLMSNFTSTAATDFANVRSEVGLLIQQLNTLTAQGWQITMTPMAIPTTTGAGGMGLEQRASGGPVFSNQLYEVAENGISELLRIGQKTFLIPGQNGTVIPPQAAPVRNNNYESVNGPTYDSSSVYHDNSQVAVYVEGIENFSMEDAYAAALKAAEEYQLNRTRNIKNKLRSSGRN